ncbi:MAG TPA: amino acid permease, partial [Chitinophagaceae bacterium]|nr:amino acid permease [Chitinophagaceae bacterium]
STETTLVRALGIVTATLLVAGIMIGSGVFKKIIPIAQTGLSEGWILAAWILAGIITMFGAFNLSGLSSLTEESGGVYEYLRLSFGNFFSFLFGWTDFTIIGSASVAALGFIFSQTINTLVPLPNPFQQWQHISIGNFIYPFADSGIKLLAIASIIVLVWVNYRGVRESGAVNNIFTSAKIAGILILIMLGLFYASPAIQQEPVITNTVQHSLHGSAFFSAFFITMLSVFWAYDGWVDISAITGEIKNPKRNVPLAIIIGVSIAMGLYVLVNYAYMKVLPLDKLAAVSENEIGAAVIAKTLLGNIGKTMIIVLIMISVFGALNGVILSHTRIYFRMAQEKFFFKKVALVHPQHRTPHIALLYTMIWSCILVISGTFEILTDMVIFATFLFYFLLALALVKMKRAGRIKVKVTGYPVVQVIIMLFSLTLLINTIVLQPKQTLTGIGLVLTGVPFYYYFKKKNGVIE